MSQTIDANAPVGSGNVKGGGQQWLRAITLVVTAGEKGLVLSNMRVRFEVRQIDSASFNNAYIRVYNLSDQTAEQIKKEFQRVVLQAGYENGEQAQVFAGNIVQTRHGHESNVDSYVDIYAVDGDIAGNFGNLNKTLEASATPEDQMKASIEAAQKADPDFNADPPSFPGGTGGIIPLARGKVAWGLDLMQHLRELGHTTGTRISIVNNKLVAVPITGYLPGEVAVLNSQTGLIGFPEISQNGLRATCLLNPKIQIGTRVRIDNRQINSVSNRGAGLGLGKPGNNPGDDTLPGPTNPFAGQFASEAADGTYRVLVVEHVGDTRSTEWYSYLTLLDLDGSAHVNSSVQANG